MNYKYTMTKDEMWNVIEQQYKLIEAYEDYSGLLYGAVAIGGATEDKLLNDKCFLNVEHTINSLRNDIFGVPPDFEVSEEEMRIFSTQMNHLFNVA